VHAFVDGSIRGSYRLVATILEPAELAAARALLRALRQGAQPRIHFQSEGDVRRRKIVAELSAAGLRTRVYLARGRHEAARQACLQRMVDDLLAAGIQRLVLETRGRREDATDRHTIRTILESRQHTVRLEYRHLRAQEEHTRAHFLGPQTLAHVACNRSHHPRNLSISRSRSSSPMRRCLPRVERWKIRDTDDHSCSTAG